MGGFGVFLCLTDCTTSSWFLAVTVQWLGGLGFPVIPPRPRSLRIKKKKTYHNRFLFSQIDPWASVVFYKLRLVYFNALGSGLPKLGMMISQTRVSDTGSDVNYKSDSLGEPESFFGCTIFPSFGWNPVSQMLY